MQERRNFVRLQSTLHVAFTVVDSPGRHEALTRNVSGGGVGFFADAKLAPGTVVEVEVAFPSRPQPVRFTGQVIWSAARGRGDPHGPPRFETGVRFLTIAPDDRTFLMLYSTLDAPPGATFEEL